MYGGARSGITEARWIERGRGRGVSEASTLLPPFSRMNRGGEGEEGEQEIRDYRGISTRKNCTCPRTRTGQVNSAVTTQGVDYVLSKLWSYHNSVISPSPFSKFFFFFLLVRGTMCNLIKWEHKFRESMNCSNDVSISVDLVFFSRIAFPFKLNSRSS